MPELDAEISAYEAMRETLEADHTGDWALLRGGELVGLYSTFEEAAAEAVKRFGAGPYLLRQIGAPPLTLPASVVYRRVDGSH